MKTVAANQPHAPGIRPRAPGWLSCELCERPASRPHRRLRLTLVRHSEPQPPPIDEPARAPGRDAARTDRSGRNDLINPAMLVLLCSDCCALIVGAIDDDEWRARIESPPANSNPPMLPSPTA